MVAPGREGAHMDAYRLLNALIAFYADRHPWNGPDRGNLDKLGMAAMLIRATQVVYGLSEDDAIERVSEALTDIYVARGNG